MQRRQQVDNAGMGVVVIVVVGLIAIIRHYDIVVVRLQRQAGRRRGTFSVGICDRERCGFELTARSCWLRSADVAPDVGYNCDTCEVREKVNSLTRVVGLRFKGNLYKLDNHWNAEYGSKLNKPYL